MKYVVIKNSGFCGIAGYVWQVLRAMWHNPDSLYYIDFTENCQYQDAAVTYTSNVWEYYFKQPHVESLPDPAEVKLTINHVIHDAESEFRDIFMANPTKENIDGVRQKFNSIIKRYVKLQPHLETKINDFVRDNFQGKRVLGVHLRGTDHPDKKPPTQYLQAIKDKAAAYDVIFCMSDEYERYNIIKTVFGNKVVSYDSIKSKTDAPLHCAKVDTYKVGEDAIVEMFILAKTDFAFCCSNSNVNYLSRAINPHLPSQSL